VPTGSPSCPPRRACLLSVSCFPKQPEIEAGGFGNWIRLPGRHPKHECYSRVWSGSRWLSGRVPIEPSSPFKA
jgi:hypothetical protein